MTRQIKFKSIDEDSTFQKVMQIDSSKYRQFTGLLDKNEKEIYEGDIIKTTFWNRDAGIFIEKEFFGYVEYKGEDGALFQITEGDYTGAGQIPLYWACHKNDVWKINGKIIGNIYENPELLTTKSPASQ